MAVLVQPLMPAQSAGVLFTADAQTGNPWHFVLESTFGLAQELVGGTGATPVDRFVLEWDSGRITKKEIADKSTRWVAGVSGLEEQRNLHRAGSADHRVAGFLPPSSAGKWIG